VQAYVSSTALGKLINVCDPEVTVSTSRGSSEYSAMLHGDLAAILNVCGVAKTDDLDQNEWLLDCNLSKSQLSVVAGARNHRQFGLSSEI
jgi:hypothetical protein